MAVDPPTARNNDPAPPAGSASVMPDAEPGAGGTGPAAASRMGPPTGSAAVCDANLAQAALARTAPMYIADLDGHLRYANAGFQQIAATLGLAVDRPVVAPGAVVDHVARAQQPLVRQHGPDPGTSGLICHGTHDVLPDADGTVIGVVATFQSMEVARDHTRALALAQSRMADIVRLATDWVWETNRDLRFTYISPRVTDLLGYHPRELHGAAWESLAVDAPPLRVDPAHGDIPPVADRDVRLRHRDGSARENQISAVPIYRGGVFVGYRGIARDVTELRQRERALQAAKEQAEQADRAKGLFLAQMSHELRTPLNAIIGFSEIIAAEKLGPAGQPAYRDYAGDILASARHLLNVINDVLDVSKIESGTFRLAEDEAEANDLMASARQLIAGQVAQMDVRVRLQPAVATVRLEVDVQRIRQVLVNLLSNAAKFTDPGGSVEVIADLRPDGSFAYKVVDSGVGMTDDEVATALTPFGQVDSSMSRRYGGIGLGLPLAQRLMEQHGGRLDIDSTPGAGTCVAAILPATRVCVETTADGPDARAG